MIDIVHASAKPISERGRHRALFEFRRSPVAIGRQRHRINCRRQGPGKGRSEHLQRQNTSCHFGIKELCCCLLKRLEALTDVCQGRARSRISKFPNAGKVMFLGVCDNFQFGNRGMAGQAGSRAGIEKKRESRLVNYENQFQHKSRPSSGCQVWSPNLDLICPRPSRTAWGHEGPFWCRFSRGESSPNSPAPVWQGGN